MALFVGRLSNDARSSDLEDVFSKYGRITRCEVKPGFVFFSFFFSFLFFFSQGLFVGSSFSCFCVVLLCSGFRDGDPVISVVVRESE